MTSPHSALIADLASAADDLLVDANRAEAVAILQDHLSTTRPGLDAADRKAVLLGVLAILDREDFFASSRGPGDVWDGAEGGEERDE